MKRAAEHPPSAPGAEGLPTIDQLLALYDREFVQRAYQAFLGRDPDADGMANYLRQLRDGVAKIRILIELATSEEGLRCAASVSGLAEAMRVEAQSAPSVWARALRRVLRASFADTERQLRVIDNRVYLVEKAITAQASLLEQLLDHARAAPRAPSVVAVDARLPAQPAAPAAPPLSHMPPTLAKTLLELKAAVALKRRTG